MVGLPVCGRWFGKASARCSRTGRGRSVVDLSWATRGQHEHRRRPTLTNTANAWFPCYTRRSTLTNAYQRVCEPPSQGGGAGSNPVGATHLRLPNSGGCTRIQIERHLGDLWPSVVCTSLMFGPAAMARLAAVWRNSCG